MSESSWENERLLNVDEVNEKLIRNVRGAAERQIGFVRTGKRNFKKPWWNADIRDARRERKRLNRQCRRLRKKRNESEQAEAEYQDAWDAYVKQQRLTKRKIMNAKVACDRSVIQSLKERGLKGGREWYRFMRGERTSGNEHVESLKVNGVCVTDKDEIKAEIKRFWEEIGGIGEEYEVREDCVTLERKDADALNERISREEVERCVKRLKNGKAAGMDDIPYEFFKNGGEAVIDWMTDLFNRVWEEERECRKAGMTVE